MSSFIGQNPYHLLLATYNEILSQMIEIWMKEHLISDNMICNIVNLVSLKKSQRMMNNVEVTYKVDAARSVTPS